MKCGADEGFTDFPDTCEGEPMPSNTIKVRNGRRECSRRLTALQRAGLKVSHHNERSDHAPAGESRPRYTASDVKGIH